MGIILYSPLVEVLRELARLSLSFQSEDLNMSTALTKLKSTVLALENLEREKRMDRV